MTIEGSTETELVFDGCNIPTYRALIYNDGILNINDYTVIMNNTNDETNGGGIENNGLLNINGGVITGDSAAGSGGGIINGGELYINGGLITNNACLSSESGIVNSGDVIMDGGIISHNSGICIQNYGTFTMNGGYIIDNESEGNCI